MGMSVMAVFDSPGMVAEDLNSADIVPTLARFGTRQGARNVTWMGRAARRGTLILA